MEIKNTRIAKMATGNMEEDQFLLRFSKYLYTTIHRTAHTYWERVHLLEAVEVPLDDCRASDGYVSPFEEDDALENQTLIDALHCLTDKQRDVLEQRYFEGRTARQIADRCDLSLVSIYDRLSRAVDALRKHMYSEEDS